MAECAAGWYCDTGYDWSERCEDNSILSWRQIAEGCGYTWIKSTNGIIDVQRDTIIDADGIVVFQEVWDPLSPSSWCLGGTIPDCADLPDSTGAPWPDVPPENVGDESECLDDGMGGAGGESGTGGRN